MNKKITEIAPSIVIFEKAINNYNKIINRAFKKSKNDGIFDARVISENFLIKNEINKNVRETMTIDVSPSFSNDTIWWMLTKKIWQYADLYAKNYNISFSNIEPAQFLYYEKDKGFYSTHVDAAPSIPRIFSAVLYLNDVEVGGETYFDKFDIAVKPVAGRLLMFPSNFAYSHGAKIPESGDKYCIVTWFTP